jgi:hypothetical protein
VVRNLTTAFKDSIIAATVKPLLLIEFFFDGSTLRFWNGVGDLVFETNTYTGSGNLLSIKTITETKNTEARGLSVQLSGIPSSLIAIALAEPYQGRQVKIRFATLDASDNIISDPFTFFSGKADVMEIQESGENSIINLSVENDLLSLNRVNDRRRTPEDQKLKYPGDTFFDQVASLQSTDVVWGRGSQ